MSGSTCPECGGWGWDVRDYGPDPQRPASQSRYELQRCDACMKVSDDKTAARHFCAALESGEPYAVRRALLLIAGCSVEHKTDALRELVDASRWLFQRMREANSLPADWDRLRSALSLFDGLEV